MPDVLWHFSECDSKFSDGLVKQTSLFIVLILKHFLFDLLLLFYAGLNLISCTVLSQFVINKTYITRKTCKIQKEILNNMGKLQYEYIEHWLQNEQFWEVYGVHVKTEENAVLDPLQFAYSQDHGTKYFPLLKSGLWVCHVQKERHQIHSCLFLGEFY